MHLSTFFRYYLSEAGIICAKLSFQFGFAHNTPTNFSTGTTTYENVIGFEPQTIVLLNRDLSEMTTICVVPNFVSPCSIILM